MKKQPASTCWTHIALFFVTSGSLIAMGACGDGVVGGVSPSDEPDATQAEDGGSGDGGTLRDGGTDATSGDSDNDQSPADVELGDVGTADGSEADGAFDGGEDDGSAFEDVSESVCSGCHGDDVSPAPPVDVEGDQSASARGVGAHRSHLGLSNWHHEIACEDCHVVPTEVDAPGHIDTALPAELTWGALSQSASASPSFDGLSCRNVYCHGATLIPGGTVPSPIWTQVDDSQGACGTCHAIPPGGHHPGTAEMIAQGRTCADCHPDINANLVFTGPERHIDGKIDVNGGACSTCHGDDESPAPPRDTLGNTETSVAGVGAHRQHLGQSPWHQEIECTACHLVPDAVSATGHIDTPLPAELVWTAGLADHDGTSPTWNGDTCSNIYCHGGTLIAGGSNTTPRWGLVDGSQDACGTCHGLPPEAPHPNSTSCSACHPSVAADLTFLAPDTHIDGVVDVDLSSCTSCHGSGNDPAPPVDTLGNTATSAPGVGAHQSHLGTSSWRATIRCSDCHRVPTAVDDPGHIDTALPAELTWGATAQADGANPSTNGTGCSGTYCHGETLGDPNATNTTPQWTVAGQADCGACHGIPPGGSHPSSSNCSGCHPTIAADMSFGDPERHIDGIVDVVALSCTSCHGSGNDPAPPVDTLGNTATSAPGVGAHQAHTAGSSSWRAVFDCSECHVVPGTINQAGHNDTALPAELTWGAFASHDGATPNYSGGTCADSYCHGATLRNDGVIDAPDWTSGSNQAQCGGACHALPPSGTHTSRTDCDSCHSTVNGAQAITSPTRHIDGIVQASCNACHGDNLDDLPDRHHKHSGEATCEDCHGGTVSGMTVVDTSKHGDGTVDVDTNLPGTIVWNSSTRRCSGRCHGERHRSESW